MSQDIPLRSGRDRLRYTVSFELTLMAFLVPAGAVFLEKGLGEIGLLGVVLSGKAMLVSLAWNWVFDHWDARRGRISSQRSRLGRLAHALGFEGCLMLTSLPIYMWWLGLALWQALATDATITTFVVGFTYVFSLAYDRVFPISGQKSPA